MKLDGGGGGGFKGKIPSMGEVWIIFETTQKRKKLKLSKNVYCNTLDTYTTIDELHSLVQ